MKASKAVTLALLGSAGILLASCGEDVPQASAFNNVDQCVNAGNKRDACITAFESAKTEGEKTAPKFSRKEECEAQFGAGNCESRGANPQAAGGTTVVQAGGGSDGGFFMPMMAGFLMGNMMSNNNSSYVSPQPLYRDRKRDYVTGSGGYVTRSFGSVNVKPNSSYVTRPAKPATSSWSSSSRSTYSAPSSSSSRSVFGSSASRSFSVGA